MGHTCIHINHICSSEFGLCGIYGQLGGHFASGTHVAIT